MTHASLHFTSSSPDPHRQDVGRTSVSPDFWRKLFAHPASTLMGAERCSLLKRCYVGFFFPPAWLSTGLSNRSVAARPNSSSFPHYPRKKKKVASSYRHECTHLDKRRCVTNGNALRPDELIFSLLMLTGHTHTHRNTHTHRKTLANPLLCGVGMFQADPQT